MSGRRLGVAAAVVGDAIVPGDVEIDGGRIAAVGVSPAGRTGLAMPGFVDLQVNGYAGVSFNQCSAEDYPVVQVELARRGTTHFLATITTGPEEQYEPALAAATAAMGQPPLGARVLGVHLEGPFLSPVRRGAHPEEHLRAPDVALTGSWLEQAPVRFMTLAPELPGAFDLIEQLVERGVTVSIGHSDADADVARAAVGAGATTHTHVWNAVRPLRARDPGTVGIALTHPGLHPCFIADLVHVTPEVLSLSIAATADRYVLVSDVVAAGGQQDGGVHLADGTLAGSTALLDEGLRNLIALGRPIPEAVAAVTSRPAALVGEPDIGTLRNGRAADVVVLDDQYEIEQVLVAGSEVGR